jgi:hypothetical protein
MPRCHRVGSLPLASGQTPASQIEAIIAISRDAPWGSFTFLLLWFPETAQNHMAGWTHCGEVDSDAEEDDHSLRKWGHYRLNCFETLTKQRLRSSCSSLRSALPTISPTFNSPEDYAGATFFPRSAYSHEVTNHLPLRLNGFIEGLSQIDLRDAHRGRDHSSGRS